MMNIKSFDPSLLSIEKMSLKSTDVVIYEIRYMTIKSLVHVNIGSKKILWLISNNAGGYIEENNGDKYLILQTRTQKYQKSTQNFAMKLKTALKQ